MHLMKSYSNKLQSITARIRPTTAFITALPATFIRLNRSNRRVQLFTTISGLTGIMSLSTYTTLNYTESQLKQLMKESEEKQLLTKSTTTAVDPELQQRAELRAEYLSQLDSEHPALHSEQFDASKLQDCDAISAPHPTAVGKPRLVILGSGWGAVSVLKSIKKDTYDIIVVSPRNYFLFTPLLPSACTGTLENRSLVEPIRELAINRHARFFESRAVDINYDSREIICRNSFNNQLFKLNYDELVVSVGAKNNSFGINGVKQHTHFLKEVTHARSIRNHLIQNFESAELPNVSQSERDRLLHAVVVGGGPTGVEFAAELHDFVVDDIKRQYPKIWDKIRISLIQSNDHLLNTYDEKISEYAEKHFKSLSINVITGAKVETVKQNEVQYIDKFSKLLVKIPFGICIWSTGIDTATFTKLLIAKLGPEVQHNKKAIVTDSKLRVLGAAAGQRIYAIGDCATVQYKKLHSIAQQLFEQADSNGDGRLSYDEFEYLCKSAKQQLPILSSHFAAARKLFHNYAKHALGPDVTRQELFIEFTDFEKFLQDADSLVKAYPATAQVAAQQGEYVANRLNALYKVAVREAITAGVELDHKTFDPILLGQKLPPNENKPFAYRHFGNLAYLGKESAAIDLGAGKYLAGVSAFWLWKSIYLSKQVSTRTRLALAFDWFKSFFFGRDTSQY